MKTTPKAKNGPKCPYCGRLHTADEPFIFEEKGFEMECHGNRPPFKTWPQKEDIEADKKTPVSRGYLERKLEEHGARLNAQFQAELAEAVGMLAERQQAETLILRAHVEALAFFAMESAGMEHDHLAEVLRKSAKTILDYRLTQLEDKNPEFAARVQAWADGEFPSFPLGEPLPPKQ